MGEKPIISLQNIAVSFDGEAVLRNLNLNIRDGEFVTLLGPSGCGKTTTLRIIGGFVTPDEGDVFFDGKKITSLPPHKREVNTIFQKYALFPHLNVYENVAFGMRIHKKSEKEIRKTVHEMLEMVSLTGFERRNVNRLSGGQQQRVAIARALMMEPQVLLFDEPTAALDPEITAQIVSIIRELAETGITQVIVTHEVEVARKTASRVVYMENGHIVEQGDAGCFAHPQTDAFKNYLSH